jgi:hypothetical protein
MTAFGGAVINLTNNPEVSMARAKGIILVLCAIVVTAWAVSPAFADEGMWTFDNPPRKQLKEKYGFEPTQEWLDHVRLSSVRVGDGGSGSFVSPNGLLLTNHHVGRGQIQKLSTPEKDLVKVGFYAKTLAEELKCPDLEINVLVSMENVTSQILGSVKAGMSAKEALDARKAMTAKITKESKEKTGLRSDMVTFYQGGEYWLYRYKKYTEINLVFCPEGRIAFFGGDDDNFTYPRYDLDMTIFRVYENGKPLKTENYLKWNAKGAAENELVFVSGNPGSTNRLQTLAQTEYQRDYAYPLRRKAYTRMLDVAKRYASQGSEQARRAAGQIFGIENSMKATGGEYTGLLDKELMAKKAAEEKDFRDKVEANPEWKAKYGWAWDSIATVIERQKARTKETTYRGLNVSLYSTAQTLVQHAEEMKKPNGERLPYFQDANIEGTKMRLFSPAPVYADMMEFVLVDRLQEIQGALGKDDPYVKTVLGDKSPEVVAKELIGGTKLADVATRKALWEGGESAIAASTDPMIVLARKLLPMVTEMRTWTEKNVSGTATAASEKLGEARFAVYGKTTYPDATFTPRLSYGSVKGYPMNGTRAPYKTTMYGLFERALSFDSKGDFELPKRFMERKDKLELSTPMDFVTTNDIIGGNSGSPVINRNAELVGLVFDGNIESLPGRFLYSETANRTVAVHSAAMIECLRKLYDAGSLADELEGVR